jgi:hypothetical protein
MFTSDGHQAARRLSGKRGPVARSRMNTGEMRLVKKRVAGVSGRISGKVTLGMKKRTEDE